MTDYTITMKNGETILLDKEDYLKYRGMSWHTIKGYAAHMVTKRDSEYWGLPVRSNVYMHRAVMGIVHGDKGIMVDHINHDRLDNRKQNLRECTASENARNLRNNVNNKSTGYKGVHWLCGQRRRPWQARIKLTDKMVYLGCYETAEEAAGAYNEAAVEHFGEFACLNVITGTNEKTA